MTLSLSIEHSLLDSISLQSKSGSPLASLQWWRHAIVPVYSFLAPVIKGRVLGELLTSWGQGGAK